MGSSRDIILLVTHETDHYTVDRVSDTLAQHGVRPVRFDADAFPLELRLTSSFSNHATDSTLTTGDKHVDASDVRAVWMRALWPPKMDEALDPQFRQACARSAMIALQGFWGALAPDRWINEPFAMQAGSNKLRQLRVARNVGLRVPRTLVTNDPEPVKAMYRELRGSMVTKLLTPLSRSMDRSGPFMSTSDVSEEDLDHLDGLRFAPMIFQERITKACELRVAYVDGRCFVGSIDASRSDEGGTDWRKAATNEARWEPGVLPEEQVSLIKVFMDAMNLAYGVLDMIHTPDNEYVFLEVNPTGEWGMLQRDLDLPIAEAIAEALLKDGDIHA